MNPSGIRGKKCVALCRLEENVPILFEDNAYAGEVNIQSRQFINNSESCVKGDDGVQPMVVSSGKFTCKV